MLVFDKEVSRKTNLERFLNCTTPVVQSQFLSQNEMRKLNKLWHPWERENIDYFTLGDLWDSFDEWSACGLGVSIVSDTGQNLVQYFVPYLSAIQIFTSNSYVHCLREETESLSETRNSFSDSFSDESESEKLSRWDGCSSEEGLFEPDSFYHMNDRLGNLYFKYFETSSPYGRVPLTDKNEFYQSDRPAYILAFVLLIILMFLFFAVRSLAQRYPGLMSLRSVDLSPASWMSVAWYPIYHIPTGRTIKDFQTCFLTYHTISSSFRDTDSEDDSENKTNQKGETISLPPFGLATNKMQGDIWISESGRDQERLVSLLSVADSWLKQLQVQHHDFDYFMGIRHG